MSKFKVGDKVLVTGEGNQDIWSEGMYALVVGKIGEVMSAEANDTCSVWFSDENCAWWFNFDNLEHVEKSTEATSQT